MIVIKSHRHSKYYTKQLTLVVIGFLLLLLLVSTSGCKDTPACEICPDGMVCNAAEEQCECPEDEYRMYDFYNERWICEYVKEDIQTDSTIKYNYVFNGNQFGVHIDLFGYPIYNQLYDLGLEYHKEKQTYQRYRAGNPIGTGSSATNGHVGQILGKRDAVNGDSIYITNMFLISKWPFYYFDDTPVLTTGRGRISPDRDTLDMTVYFLDMAKTGINPKPNEPLSVADALDVRKMTLLSSRVLPKF